MMNTLKSISFLAVIVSLTACGGGGGGGGGSSSPAPVQPSVDVSLPVSNLAVDEGGSTTFRVTATDGAEISFTGAQITSIQKDGDEYVLTAGQVDRPVTEQLQVTASLKGATAKVSLNVAINDASAQAMVSEASGILANKQSALELEEDGALFKAMVESLYLQSALEEASATSLSGPMSFAEKEALLDDFNPAQEPHYNTLSQSLTSLTQTLESYSKGQASETQLESVLASTQSAVEMHATSGAQKLSPYFNALYPNVNLESETTLSFSSELGRFTRYIGNSSFGSYQDGAWVFDAQYGLLNSVIPTNDNNIGFCEG